MRASCVMMRDRDRAAAAGAAAAAITTTSYVGTNSDKGNIRKDNADRDVRSYASETTATLTATSTRRTQDTTPSTDPTPNSSNTTTKPKSRGIMLCAGGKNIGDKSRYIMNGGDIMGIVTQVNKDESGLS